MSNPKSRNSSKPTRRTKRVQKPARRYGRAQQLGTIPAAVRKVSSSSFSMRTTSPSSAVISGCDLVYATPQSVSATQGNVFAVITANPCFWPGTRIAQAAPGYQLWRPLKLSFEYVPQVAVTQEGSVVMGTLWGTSVADSSLQQSLLSSNGGLMTQVYTRVVTEVKLGSNLPLNLFHCNGSLTSTECNPFVFIAMATGAGNVSPGYFFVRYTYALHNPIGQAKLFSVVNSTQLEASDSLGNPLLAWGIQLAKAVLMPLLMNAAVVLLRSAADAITARISGAGSVLTVPDGEQMNLLLSRSPSNSDHVPLIDQYGNVVYLPGTTPVFFYENGDT